MDKIEKIQSETSIDKVIVLKLASYGAEFNIYNGEFHHLKIENESNAFYFSTLPGAKRFIDLIDGVHDLIMDLENKDKSKGIIP